MDYKDISAHITGVVEDIVYVSNPKTYEIEYLNKMAISVLKLTSDEQWKGKKCYKVLQGKSKPCEFCTNHLLSEDEFYNWEYYNPILKRYFSLQDRFIKIEDQVMRLEIATDITKRAEIETNLRARLQQEKVLNSCIETLHSTEAPFVSIEKLLKIISKHYGAIRGYIFELNEDRTLMSNTYEWCANNIPRQQYKLQNIKTDLFQQWFNQFEIQEELFISSVDKDKSVTKMEIDFLLELDINSILMVPLKDNEGNVNGFIGIDNPQLHLSDFSIIRYVSKFIIDFLDKNQLIEELNSLSYKDLFTGLKNRNSYRELLKHYQIHGVTTLGVAYIDVEDLRVINEVHGHKYGDQLIFRLSKKLVEIFGVNTFRLGGNEFVVLCERILESKFESKIADLKAWIQTQTDMHISLVFSFNKGEIGNTKVITGNKIQLNKKSQISEYDQTKEYREILSQNLINEIAQQRFVVFLQPQVVLATDKVISAEALVRRISSDGKLQPPNSFIPFYEKEKIIAVLDFFVFKAVCNMLSKWKENGYKERFRIAVNFSRLTLMEKGIAQKLKNICEEQSINASQIVIEVTETIRSMEDSLLAQIIKTFSDEGFSLSLDDFGSGHSNLAIITNAHFDEIKIDKSLIDNIVDNEKATTITNLAITMCEQLDTVTSVAEGIELPQQLELLKTMKCRIGQGYYFDKPIPLNVFEEKYIFAKR